MMQLDEWLRINETSEYHSWLVFVEEGKEPRKVDFSELEYLEDDLAVLDGVTYKMVLHLDDDEKITGIEYSEKVPWVVSRWRGYYNYTDFADVVFRVIGE